MNIALVFPRDKYPTGDPPLGISYIKSYIDKNSDCNVDVLDTTFDNSESNIVYFFKRKPYDIIGISVLTPMINNAIRIADIAKKINPDSKIVFGGPHPTVLPEESLRNKSVDAVVIGEGEETFLEIVKKDCNFYNIRGIWFKENGLIVKNQIREPIGDLNNLPFPSLDSLPMNEYIKNWFQLDSVDPNLIGTNIIASRGCPYNCSFCQPTLEKIFGKFLRKRSPKNIIEEIIQLKEKFGINAIMFQDDTLTCDHKWVFEICDEIIDNNLNIIWGFNTRAGLVSKELLIKVKEAGARKIFLGIESASQRILNDIYNKNITTEQVINTVNLIKKFNFKIQGYFMIGAPTETVEEIEETIKLAKNLAIDEATFSITTPLPCTYLYEKSKSLIAKDFSEFDYYKRTVYGKGCLTQNQLDYLRRKALLEFYLSRKRISQTIKSFLSINGIRKSIKKLKRF